MPVPSKYVKDAAWSAARSAARSAAQYAAQNAARSPFGRLGEVHD